MSAGAWRLRAVVLLVLAALAGGGRSVAAAGVRYEPAGGGFSAEFPAAPEKYVEREHFGSFVMTIAGYGLDYEGVGYFVSHFNLPAQVMADPRIEEMLYTRMESEFSMLGKRVGRDMVFSVAARSDVTLGSYKGRQCVFNGKTAMGVMRGYKAGQRFYLVGVFGDKDAYSAQRAVAFLDSFKLTGKSSRQ